MRGRHACGACLKEIITCRWSIPHSCLCWQSHTPPNAPLLYVHKHIHKPYRELMLFSFASPPRFLHVIEKIRGLWNEAQLSMLVSMVTLLELVQLSLVITSLRWSPSSQCQAQTASTVLFLTCICVQEFLFCLRSHGWYEGSLTLYY